VLDGGPSHLDVAGVATAVRGGPGSLSTQAVYDILAAFVEVGLVRRIEPSGHPARFEARVHDNHHHLVCRSCGDIRDVDCVVGYAPCLTPDDPGGFTLDEAEITFWVLCPDCTIANQTPRHEERRCPGPGRSRGRRD
jgi:Fur family ferric uptake transcriptional regulator